MGKTSLGSFELISAGSADLLARAELPQVEPGSNLILKKVGARWLSALTVGFGAVTIGSAFSEFLSLIRRLGGSAPN